MVKYYIQCGSHKSMLLANNAVQASILALSDWLRNVQAELGRLVFVSQRGFEGHDDDLQYTLEEVVDFSKLRNS